MPASSAVLTSQVQYQTAFLGRQNRYVIASGGFSILCQRCCRRFFTVFSRGNAGCSSFRQTSIDPFFGFEYFAPIVRSNERNQRTKCSLLRVRTGALLCEQREIDLDTDVEIISCSKKLRESIVSRMTRSLLIQSLSDTAESFAPLGPNVAGSFFYALMISNEPSIG